ncbi:hypothetical protein AB0C87_24745 [Actinomadura sp. NPDC048021]
MYPDDPTTCIVAADSYLVTSACLKAQKARTRKGFLRSIAHRFGF